MKCLSLSVDWMHSWSNDPTLKMLVDKLDWSNLRYKQTGSLYFAERDGLVSFYYYAQPDEGYGGRTFHITLEDGTERDLHGPWSSAPSTMNANGFTPCVDSALTDEAEVWQRGYTFYGGHVTLTFAATALKELLPNVELRQAGSLWIPHSVTGCKKTEGNTSRYVCPVCNPTPKPKIPFSSTTSEEQNKVIGYV